MLVIAVFGTLLVLVSLWMIAWPVSWVEQATAYCRSRYMHAIEIAICLGFGASFIVFAEQSTYPTLFQVFGCILVTVGVGLMLVPPSFHRRYGVWSMQKMAPYFRPLGFVSLAFGAFLVYVAIRSICFSI